TVVHYDDIEAIWDYEFEDYQSSGSGFEFSDVHYSNNTAVSVEVEEVVPDKIDFLVHVGAEEEIDSNDHIENAFFYSLMLYFPIFFPGYVNPWNQTRMDLGRSLIRSFFLDYDNMNSVFIAFGNDTFLERKFDVSAYVINRVSGKYIVEPTIAIYNYLLDCIYIGTSGLDTYAGNFTFQLAFNPQTDIVMGFEMYMNYSGYRNAEYYNVFYYYKVERAGYNLPELYYEVDVIPTSEAKISVKTLVSISVLGLGIIIVRRKIKKVKY
ncbi:MAG: choice-of-anchor S family protein, partial [Candidatus Heimdallarchaeota archaeon]